MTGSSSITQKLIAVGLFLLAQSGVSKEVIASTGLRAYWSSNISHATRLGQIDWTDYDHTTIEDDIDWPSTRDPFYADGPTDWFSLRLVGTINIPTTGSWAFQLSSDAGARLWIDGKLVINDDANHSFRAVEASIDLNAGAHTIELRYMEQRYSAGLELRWKAPTATTYDLVPTSAFSPAALVPPGESGGGLRTYWAANQSHAEHLGQIDWFQYDATTIEKNLSYRLTRDAFYDGGPTDWFAAKFVGTINIPTSGTWTLAIGSDAGMRLWIDGKLVIDDDANHSFRWKEATISLTAGPHDFELRYMEQRYSAGLFATWKGPSDAYESVIPSSAFTASATIPSGDAGGGLRAYWASNQSHAERLGQIDWYTYDATTVEDKLAWRLTREPFYDGGPDDWFTAKFAGQLKIPDTGNWTIAIGSDAGTRLWIDGDLIIDDDANHSFRWKEATVSLTAGPHDFELRYMEQRYSAGLFATWKGPSDAYESVIPSSAFTASATIPSGDAGGGLRAFWAGNQSHATNLGQVDWSTYDDATTESKLAWRLTRDPFYAGGEDDWFAARFTGKINIKYSGTWIFAVGSDAGARLWIDGTLVVDDDANHSFRWKEGSIALTAGEHDFEVRYMEQRYSAGLFATWKGPSDAYESVIPSSAFTLGQEPEAETGGGLRAEWFFPIDSLISLTQFEFNKPSYSSTVSSICWPQTRGAFYEGGPDDYFALQLTSRVLISKAGEWKFSLGSDQAARLYINDTLVVDDANMHSWQWKSETITLSEGWQDIKIQYIEQRYSAGLVTTWQGPDDDYESVIPTTAFPASTPKRIIRWREVRNQSLGKQK